jgi:hypothetical protein
MRLEPSTIQLKAQASSLIIMRLEPSIIVIGLSLFINNNEAEARASYWPLQ